MVEKDKNNNYISLQEATEYCPYSQEYLSLRARQGKLRAVKLGRNWVTTKEWLDGYLDGVVDYSNNLRGKKKVEKKTKALNEPPQNLPIGEPKLVEIKPFYVQIGEAFFSPTVRFGFPFCLVLVLIIAGMFFAKDSFKEVMAGMTAPFRNELSKIEKGIAEDEIYSATISGTIETFKEYGQWLDNNINKQIREIRESSPVVAIGETLRPVWRGAKEGYFVFDNFIERKISDFVDGFYKFSKNLDEGGKVVYQFVVEPRPEGKPEKEPKEKTPKDLTKDVEFIRQEIKELKEKEFIVKEIIKEIQVSQVTRVEPVREVTKEIIKIDDITLANLQSQVVEFAGWKADIESFRAITQKLQANPANTYAPTAPIYIASQGLQVAGAGNFTSLGVSGPLGAKDLGVSDSTSLGSISSDTLTVKATSTFESPVTLQTGLTIGTGTTSYSLPSSDGTSGQALRTDGSGAVTWGSVAGLPGGSTGQIQYNSAGSFGGASQFYYDATNNRVGIGIASPDYPLELLSTTTPQLALSYTDNSAYSTLSVDASGDLTILASGGDISLGNENLTTTGTGTFSSLAVGTAYTFPTTDATADYYLKTDGSGIVSWAAVSAAATPGGLDSQIQYNNGGSFGGTSQLSYDDSSGLLTITTVSQGAAVGQGSLYINPATATADYTLLGLAVGGSEKFRVDEDGDITAGAWQGTAVGASFGGTDQSSYATGDILYASGATALSKLTIGTADYVLTSSGTAPQWSTSLTISGLTVSGLTSGRVTYATSGGQLTDSANLTFNGTTLTAGGFSTTGTLAAGTANISGLATFSYVPQGTGVAQGSLYINPATATADYTLLGLAVGGSEKFRVDEDGDIVKTGNITMADSGWLGLGSSAGRIIFDDATTDYIYLLDSYLGIATTGPDAPLDVLATSGAQLRLSYTDGSVYSDFTTDSSGYLVIDPSGDRVGIGTASPAALLHLGETRTSGTIYKVSYPSSTTLADAVYGLDIDLSTNVIPATSDILALRLTLPSTGTGDRTFAQFREGSTTLYDFDTVTANFDLPASFNSAGDVSIVYDLQFTNDTASYIRSYAPLYIEAGDPNFNRDLTFRASGTGEVIVNDDFQVAYGGSDLFSVRTTGLVGVNDLTPNAALEVVTSGNYDAFMLSSSVDGDGDLFIVKANSGRVGIGQATPDYKLDVNGAIGARALGSDPATPDTNAFVLWQSDGTGSGDDGDIMIKITQSTGDAKITTLVDFSGADIAEYYGSYDPSLEPGDLVIIDETYNNNPKTGQSGNKSYVKKSTEPYQLSLVGIVSTDPHDTFGDVFDKSDNPKPIALAGRTPVRVSLENGQIEPGDFLTSSSVSAIAMKAIEPGPIIGKALEPFNSEETGKIMVFVNIGWYGGELSEEGILEDETAPESEVAVDEGFVQKVKKALSYLGIFIEDGIAQIREIITEKLSAKTVRIQTMEMIDQRTGDVYCSWIEYGEMKRVRGSCETIEFNNEPSFAPSSGASEDREGCTDSQALNYNPDATVDDGSCEYPEAEPEPEPEPEIPAPEPEPSLPEIPPIETASPLAEGIEQ